MVPPEIMCGAHLRGEHAEIHMFIGAFRKKKAMDGFIREDCLEIMAIIDRHKELAAELIKRGGNHKSWDIPKTWEELYKLVEYLPSHYILHHINKVRSQLMLLNRCEECKVRYETYRESTINKTVVERIMADLQSDDPEIYPTLAEIIKQMKREGFDVRPKDRKKLRELRNDIIFDLETETRM